MKSFRQALSSPLDANAKLTLTLSLGDIFSEESSGDFTVDDWNEKNENIDIKMNGPFYIIIEDHDENSKANLITFTAHIADPSR